MLAVDAVLMPALIDIDVVAQQIVEDQLHFAYLHYFSRRLNFSIINIERKNVSTLIPIRLCHRLMILLTYISFLEELPFAIDTCTMD